MALSGFRAYERREAVISQLAGVATTALSLVLVVVTADALVALDRGVVAHGLVLLAVVIVARTISAEALQAWLHAVGVQRRGRWRSTLWTFVRSVSSEGSRALSSLLWAIEADADAAALDVLRASAATSALALIMVFVTGGWISAGVVVALLVLAVPLYQRAGVRAAQLEAAYRERRTLVAQRQLELLYHASELRGVGALSYGARDIGALSDTEHALALRAIRAALGSSLVTEFISGVSVGLVAMVVGFGLLRGHEHLVDALVAMLATSELFGHVRRYGVAFHRREAADAARDQLRVPQDAPAAPSTHLLVAHEVVTQASSRPVTLCVGLSDRIVIRGPSGAGKTTLVQTLLGWRAPVGGHVERSTQPLAYVGASSALLEGTLRENVTLGTDCSDAGVRAHLEAVGLGGARFGDLDAVVSTDGHGLSSGERVRLLVARAVCNHARALIIDDVSGLLDAEARDALRSCLATVDAAVVEVCVDEPTLIESATHVVVP